MLQLTGTTQSAWLLTTIRRAVLDVERQMGKDLFEVLTPDEQHVFDALANGAATLLEIKAETGIEEARVESLLDELVKRKHVEKRKRGGKGETARGAQTDYWFVVERRRAASSLE